MRIPGGAAGPRGLTLLLVTAVAGIVLAVHGWSGRHSGLTPGALGGSGSPAPAGSSSSPSPAGSPSPRNSPKASAAAGHATGPNAAKAGPLLSSQSYASYSFQVWPGTPNAAAKAAMTGLSISVGQTGSGISVRAGVNGQPRAAAHLYPGGARVYVVEASLGDDASNSDYNLGDDGVLVTDTHGRILQ
jgi:hypothetical protein